MAIGTGLRAIKPYLTIKLTLPKTVTIKIKLLIKLQTFVCYRNNQEEILAYTQSL